MGSQSVTGCGRFHGRFYFKLTDNGNLIGEYSNNESDWVSTESADRVSENCTSAFDGRFYSTWQENGKRQFAELSICAKQGRAKLFALEWKDKSGEPCFVGEAMLCDGILFGDYHKPK